MDIPKIKVDQLKLTDIIIEFDKGQIRIPKFQRNYVWDRPRVVKLLNSIYKEYPIGTFFFWEADRKYLPLYRNIPELTIPEPRDGETFHFILDGQQRITSLWAVIKGITLTIIDNYGNPRKINYGEISFDLDNEEFVIKRPDNVHYIALATILEEDHFEAYEAITNPRKISFRKCYNQFRNYPLSVVYVREQELNEASEIFERINQGGIKLSVFDLVVASTWSEDFDLKEKVKEFNQKLESTGFGAIDPSTIVQTMSLISKGQAIKSAQLQLTNDDVKKLWAAVIKGIELAIDIISNNFGARIYDFVPYSAMITMVAYLFIKNENKSLTSYQKEILEQWFWKSTFSERYKVSTQSLMSEDKRNIFDPLIEGEKVSVNYPINISSENIINARFYKYSGIRNGIYCLLAQEKPLHFLNNSHIILDKKYLSDYNSSEKHHIFPRAFLKKINNAWLENSMTNFAFIPSELNRKILDKSPKQYFAQVQKENPEFEKMIKSHLISMDAVEAAIKNDFDSFISARSNTILKAIEKKIGSLSAVEKQLEENPDSFVNSLEEKIRLCIDENLSRSGEGYWKNLIPGDIQEKIARSIKRDSLRYQDGAHPSNYDLLSYCDFGDYTNIVLKNWQKFEDEFKSKGDFETNMKFVADFRNHIKHNRKISDILRKQGEAAIEWLNNCLEEK